MLTATDGPSPTERKRPRERSHATGNPDPMSLYRIDDNAMEPVPETSFHTEGLQERRDLQQLVINQPSALGSDLFIVKDEFENWSDSARRIDLLAIDEDGTLTVVELKRDENPGPMELQALRYAAMVANTTFEQLVDAHKKFGESRGLDGDASSRIDEFLSDKEVNRDDLQTAKPRIILVAPDFPTELATSVLWLNDAGLDIRCVRLLLYRAGDQLFVDTGQVIPLPEADDYLVRVREREKAEEVEKVTRRRRARTSKILVDSGLIRGGEKIMLYARNLNESDDFDLSDPKWHAQFIPDRLGWRKNVEWLGSDYSLSSLTTLLRDQHAAPIPFIGPYLCWCLVDQPGASLAELANSLRED